MPGSGPSATAPWSCTATATRSCRLANGRFLAGALPHGRLEVISGAGHLFLLDEPQSVMPALGSFLGSD